MNIPKALKLLDEELNKHNCQFTLFVAGGAALRLLGIISRETVDVDIITDALDPILLEARAKVARKLRISEEWLNNKVSPLGKRLQPGWQIRSVRAFESKNLTVFALSRQDLICAKLHAAVDRHAEDYNDLIAIKPNLEELAIARIYTLKLGDTETYQVFVDGILNILKKELGLK